MILRAVEYGMRYGCKTTVLLQCTRRPLLNRGQALASVSQFIASVSKRYFEAPVGNNRFSNVISKRSFASSEPKPGLKDRSSPTVMKWSTFAVVVVVGSVVIYFVRRLKNQKDAEMKAQIAKHTTSIGKSLIGGPWELVNYDNQPVSWRDYLGKWLIIYFGFTHCPDICPEELEKLINVVETLKKNPTLPQVHPLFFTVDPYRDKPENIKKYCQEYSPELMGFSGSVEQVSKVCKTFRVYFSEGAKMDNDYIVDHSIIMYLINPEGEYVEHYSRETPQRRMEIKVRKQIQAYEAAKNA